MKYDVVMKQFKLNIPYYFWVKFSETKETTAVLQTG